VLKGIFALVALIGLSLASALALATADAHDKVVAVVLPPWWSQAQSLNAAGETAAIAGVGGLPFVILIPNDPPRPRLSGEWLRLHLSILPGCFGEKAPT